MQPIKVLIVDDSATMRTLIDRALRDDPEISVIGMAGDAYEAREMIKARSPDVITLDIEMPRMSGLDFLDKVMHLRPLPVIMISSLTQAGCTMAIEALARGAFECVGKPTNGDLSRAFLRLPRIIKAAHASAIPQRRERSPVAQTPSARLFKPNRNVVAIGASTGGVEAINAVLSHFPENCPPTVIAQHMPAGFTASFAARLNQSCAPSVTEAIDGAELKNGHVYLAPGGNCHLEISQSGKNVVTLREGPLESGHRPSVDVLFSSVARLRSRAVGVILTGMGKDGAKGLSAIREAGGKTIGQNEATSIVYGMPRIAFEAGAVEKQLPLSKIGAAVLRMCNADSEAVA